MASASLKRKQISPETISFFFIRNIATQSSRWRSVQYLVYKKVLNFCISVAVSINTSSRCYSIRQQMMSLSLLVSQSLQHHGLKTRCLAVKTFSLELFKNSVHSERRHHLFHWLLFTRPTRILPWSL